MKPKTPKPHIDAVWDELFEAWVHPFKCECCKDGPGCWLYLEGIYRGKCVYLGPYYGYIEVKDE